MTVAPRCASSRPTSPWSSRATRRRPVSRARSTASPRTSRPSEHEASHRGEASDRTDCPAETAGPSRNARSPRNRPGRRARPWRPFRGWNILLFGHTANGGLCVRCPGGSHGGTRVCAAGKGAIGRAPTRGVRGARLRRRDRAGCARGRDPTVGSDTRVGLRRSGRLEHVPEMEPAASERQRRHHRLRIPRSDRHRSVRSSGSAGRREHPTRTGTVHRAGGPRPRVHLPGARDERRARCMEQPGRPQLATAERADARPRARGTARRSGDTFVAQTEDQRRPPPRLPVPGQRRLGMERADHHRPGIDRYVDRGAADSLGAGSVHDHGTRQRVLVHGPSDQRRRRERILENKERAAAETRAADQPDDRHRLGRAADAAGRPNRSRGRRR